MRTQTKSKDVFDCKEYFRLTKEMQEKLSIAAANKGMAKAEFIREAIANELSNVSETR